MAHTVDLIPGIDARTIMQVVSVSTKVDVSDMKSGNREKRAVKARQLAAWLMRRHTTMTLHEIADAIALKGRTSALNAINQVSARILEGDKEVQQRTRVLTATLMKVGKA